MFLESPLLHSPPRLCKIMAAIIQSGDASSLVLGSDGDDSG